MSATTASSEAGVRPVATTCSPSLAKRLQSCAPSPRSGPTPIITALCIGFLRNVPREKWSVSGYIIPATPRARAPTRPTKPGHHKPAPTPTPHLNGRPIDRGLLRGLALQSRDQRPGQSYPQPAPPQREARSALTTRHLCGTPAAQGGKNEPIENLRHSDVARLPRPVDGQRARARLRERADPFRR